MRRQISYRLKFQPTNCVVQVGGWNLFPMSMSMCRLVVVVSYVMYSVVSNEAMMLRHGIDVDSTLRPSRRSCQSRANVDILFNVVTKAK